MWTYDFLMSSGKGDVEDAGEVRGVIQLYTGGRGQCRPRQSRYVCCQSQGYSIPGKGLFLVHRIFPYLPYQIPEMILREYEALSRDETASNTYQAGKLNLIWYGGE